MTIYIDIVLLENLLMNYIILLGTGYIIKAKIKHIKLIISSFIGAIYALLAYMEIFPIYANFITKMLLAICMIYIGFNPKKIKGLIKELIVFFLVSFSLGGCAFALLYMIKPQEIFVKNGVYIGVYPLKIALLGGITGFIITYISFKVVKNHINKNEIIYTAIIKIEEKKLEIKVLLDTGNMLKDPITGDTVIIVEKEKLYEILPIELLNDIDNFFEINNKIIKNEYQTRLRIIPFTSVGKRNGMMVGIKADYVSIITDIDEIKKDNAIICVYEKKFSKTDKYSGLIGLDILEGSEKNEYIANIKK